MTYKSGRCLCGKVQYKISGPPISQGVCYCLQCQRSGGAFGSPLMVLHQGTFDCSQDTLSSCKTKSDRGSIVTRNFCRECGSHIFSQISDVPEIITVKAATLDDPSDFTPQYLVWVSSAPLSCAFPKGVPSFPENAPLEMVLSLGYIFGMNFIPSSKRLSYKLISMVDLTVFSKLAQDHHVREFLMEGQEFSTEECQALISAGLDLHSQHGLSLYLISTSDEVIGYCGFMNTHPPSGDLDVVYAFPTKYTGKGYATEVCKALVEFAKASNFGGGISAVVNPENKASIKVLEKCGFASEGFCIGDLNHLLKYRYR